MNANKRYFKRKKNDQSFDIAQNVIKTEIVEEKHFYYWIPRILSLVFIGFLSIFALDVFSSYQGIHIVFPLIMHLLPEMILLGFTLFVWKFDLYEAGVFLAFGLLYIVSVGLKANWTWYVFVSGPALLISFLFFVNWYIRKKKDIAITP